MVTIVPYDESIIAGTGAFITPDAGFMRLDSTHEEFAERFCNGKNYDLYKSIKEGKSYYSTHFSEFQEKYNFPGTIDELDEFASTRLTKKELELYKLWLEKVRVYRTHDSLSTDFMIYMLGFDKVERILTNCITTSHYSPHIRFYNYYLMEWNIARLEPVKYNPEKDRFENFDTTIWGYEDQEAEAEIEDIKRLVRIKDRPLFFK